MSLLDRLPPDVRPAPVGPVMALLAGLWTAAVSWLAVVLPALLAWATSAQATASWDDAVRVATGAWLVLHRVGLDVPGGSVALVPFAGAALPVWLCWIAGRRIGASLEPRAVAAAGSPLRAVAPAVACLAVGYACVLVLAAVVARGDGVRPVVWQAVVAGLALPAASGTLAALRACGRPALETLAVAVRLPERIRRTARAAGVGAAALLGAGALLLTVALVLHLDRVLQLHRALDPGVIGGAVLTLGQVALVPNLGVWALSFLVGPGFAVGTGTLVSPGGSQLGMLPLVPVLGAAPPPGELPGAVMAVVLVPVLVGMLVGHVAVRRPAGSATTRAGALDALAEALTAVVTTTALLTALVALGGGSAGPGAMSAVGPSPWRVALVLAGELAAGAAVAAWATHRRQRT